MSWFRIEKENTKQPAKGSYKDWKEILAVEGGHQCVYCAVSERSFGGIRNFHVEHYRPKSFKRFETLTNDIRNLYYACPICNTFKGDDWPNDPSDDLAEECYAEPSAIDYTYLFMLTTTSEITGKNVAARYMVEKLYLNRPQLIMERREEQIFVRLNNINQHLRQDIEMLLRRTDTESHNLVVEYIQNRDKMNAILIEARKLPPYHSEDVSR